MNQERPYASSMLSKCYCRCRSLISLRRRCHNAKSSTHLQRFVPSVKIRALLFVLWSLRRQPKPNITATSYIRRRWQCHFDDVVTTLSIRRFDIVIIRGIGIRGLITALCSRPQQAESAVVATFEIRCR